MKLDWSKADGGGEADGEGTKGEGEGEREGPPPILLLALKISGRGEDGREVDVGDKVVGDGGWREVGGREDGLGRGSELDLMGEAHQLEAGDPAEEPGSDGATRRCRPRGSRVEN